MYAHNMRGIFTRASGARSADTPENRCSRQSFGVCVVTAIVLMAWASQPAPVATASDSQPAVVDVRDTAFAVAWTTASASQSTVQWTALGGAFQSTATDVRGPAFIGRTHLVRVTGLTPATDYEYSIVSGAGVSMRVRTGPGISIPSPDSILGRAVDPVGRAVRDALVTVVVRSGNRETGPLIALITDKDDGYWTVNLGNARAKGELGVFVAGSDARVSVTIASPDSAIATAEADVEVARAEFPAIKVVSAPVAIPVVLATVPPLQPGTVPTISAPGVPSSGTSLDPRPLPAPVRSQPAIPTTGLDTQVPLFSAVPVIPGVTVIPTSTDPFEFGPAPLPGMGGSPENQPTPVRRVAPFGQTSLARDVAYGPASLFPIGNEEQITITASDQMWTILANAGIARVRAIVDAEPVPESDSQAGSLGGGIVIPVSRPIKIRIEAFLASGESAPPGLVPETEFQISMPVLPGSPKRSSVFAWLVATYDNTGFAGYVRMPSAFDAETNRVLVSVPLNGLASGALFLPALLANTSVLIQDAEARLFSRPDELAVDFGLAGDQFSELEVVAPQVRDRLFVFSPVTENYGWIDALKVGPNPRDPR
jgi:hypothetical protein